MSDLTDAPRRLTRQARGAELGIDRRSVAHRCGKIVGTRHVKQRDGSRRRVSRSSPGARGGVRDAARCGHVSRLDPHDVPRARAAYRGRASDARPEPLATRPNEPWSTDITKLRGATRGTSLHLDVVIDVFSRCVVGWMVAQCERQTLARTLFRGIYERERVKPGQVTVHADRGAAMTSRGLADLFVTLGI
ncbi:MAG: transposase family protein, partial [Myxococcales bacterium]|nr:transposase family protein [Myxococcales bacterium]